MKITFLYYKCYLGGLESATKNKMDYLTDLGADCQIVFIERGVEDQTFCGYNHHVTSDQYILENLTRDSNIIINLSPFDIMFKRAYKLNKPIIHECHCGGAYEYLGRLDPDKIKAVIFPTEYNQSRAGSIITRDIPAFVSHNCLGKSFLDKNPNVLVPLKKIILWVGRVEYYKNWTMIIKLAQKLGNDYLIRVVTDTALSSNYKDFLREIENKHLKGKIEVDTDCPYDAMSYHYFQAAISGCYLSSSYSESFGMTVLESMYAGCPMVLSDLPTFREIAGDCAVYFSANDLDACLKDIYKVCADTPFPEGYASFRETMISGATSRYEENYNPVKTCRGYMDIIEGILNKS